MLNRFHDGRNAFFNILRRSVLNDDRLRFRARQTEHTSRVEFAVRTGEYGDKYAGFRNLRCDIRILLACRIIAVNSLSFGSRRRREYAFKRTHVRVLGIFKAYFFISANETIALCFTDIFLYNRAIECRFVLDCDDKIAYARNRYNMTTARYNMEIVMIPGSIVASQMGLQKEALYEISQTQRDDADNMRISQL